MLGLDLTALTFEYRAAHHGRTLGDAAEPSSAFGKATWFSASTTGLWLAR